MIRTETVRAEMMIVYYIKEHWRNDALYKWKGLVADDVC